MRILTVLSLLAFVGCKESIPTRPCVGPASTVKEIRGCRESTCFVLLADGQEGFLLPGDATLGLSVCKKKYVLSDSVRLVPQGNEETRP